MTTNSFVLFSTPHLVFLLALLLVSVFMLTFKSIIQHSSIAKRTLRYTIIGILMLSEIGLDGWNILNGSWSIRYTLPLELCSISLLLSIVMMITRNHILYQILFFAGIGGALQALITPNIGYGYPHFRFLQFFIAHIFIVLASLYMTWIEGYRPTWKSIGLTMIFLNILAVIIGTADYLLGSNYMFLMSKPDTPSILDFLGPYPYYLFVEELLAGFIFVLMYLLFFVIPSQLRRKQRPKQINV
ncbi:YwaF family protein [Paenibacillus pini]|uniref:ABC transporter n=1 Tax=Paenibacillus pini JCM 16418 TaxID=1236976 RepID=W7Y5S8_9BACL|nr:TIGR02206 family membrane protein [Paenibacillus pini]GAF06125.1 ABC transporter [Paenibacillus pini JCM 16418]